MEAESKVSTPSSAASQSPIAPSLLSRQPSLSMKPIAAAAPVPLKPCSITTKEWVIPPRPKPGRKPATDTPPTKRKAQNRAAQRAFRERRAARVGELEEQLKQIEEENERDEAALHDQVQDLSDQLQQCRNEVSWWKKRCQTLETDLASEKKAKTELAKNSLSTGQGNATREVAGGCERCSSVRCQCIDDAFDVSNLTVAHDEPSGTKRAHSPHQADAAKRQRPGPQVKAEPLEMETDFTTRFAFRSAPRNVRVVSSPSPLVDPCGFCQDGTPCICAEMAAEEQNEEESLPESNKLAPIQNFSQFTPPPSEGDVHPEPLPSIASLNSKANPCANGPGTCAQCVADPRSTLFCKSLAASRAGSAATEGCCGGSSSGGGCCQSRSSSRVKDRGTGSNDKNNASIPPITLTCADAFTTLSRHPNFNQASDELTAWLPRLHTSSKPRDIEGHESSIRGRPAMEVEAASVMGVLRYFDRRFGQE